MSTAALAISPLGEDYEAALQETLALRPAIEEVMRDVVERGVRNVFLVGSGGSLASLYAAHYELDRKGAAFAVSILSSGEFNARRPATLGRGSLVIAASHRGITPETVEAARFARKAGATVIAVTRDESSPLARAATNALPYHRDLVSTDAKHVLLAILVGQLLERTRVEGDYSATRRALDAVPAALATGVREREEANAAIARRLAGEPIVYVIGSGPSYGTAYAFAMCYLQESQWMHAAAFTGAEFFHGAFEVVDESVPVIVILDESDARPLSERALAFVQRYSATTFAIDSRDLTLPGIEPALRPLITPIAIAAVVGRLGAHFAAVSGHGFDDRRYMFKVEY